MALRDVIGSWAVGGDAAAGGAVGGGAVLEIAGVRIPVVGTARVYVCGITPYDTTHLGHAATFVWTDVAARVLHLAGAHVDVCRNVTDVDDHLLAEAAARHVPWRSLASQQTYRFEQDATDLGLARPAFEPRSHDYVDDVIALGLELVHQGHAYVRDGTVLFRGAGVPERAGLDREAALAALAATGPDPAADDPLDTAIWQRSTGDEPGWPSPWGHGRPGWHVECAAMAVSTFGPTVDLHGGGEDLRFPHHAYEAAIAEAFTGVAPFSRAYMHVGTVMVDGRKMAKSTGNLVFVHDLLERSSAAALRYLLLSRPWREPWSFDEADLGRAERELHALWRGAGTPVDREGARRAVVAALLDDLDVPRALGVASEAGGAVLAELIEFLGLTDTSTWW